MPLNENINLELISLVWLDNMADATQENREIQTKLRSIVNYLKIFDNCQQCKNYLQNEINIEEDKIILIVSGRLGQEIIEHIYNLKQILSIFVFCMDKTRNDLWAKKYKKIRNVVTEIDDLYKEIEIECKSDEHKLNQSIIDIRSDKNNIIEILLKTNYSFIDRREFLNICYKEYEENISELENIQEFEHLYSYTKSLNYFFKETFLYRLLIKSLQIFNIDMLYLLRFFLQDIEKQLESLPIISTIVYYGQYMTTKQIEYSKYSINKNIFQFNSFIIAKKSREQIIKTLQNSKNKNNFNLVLFHIERNQIGKQYNEFILFPITTKFKIISIDYQNNIYIIKIILLNSNLSLNNKYCSPIQLGYRLRDLGRLDEAEKIFNRLSLQYPLGKSKIYDGLAKIAQDKGLYEISLELYKKSLLKISSKNRPHCLNNIGCIYDYLEEYDKALKYYSKALNLMKNNIDQAMCINNIGITLANQQKYQDALQCFQQSLSIRQKFLSENHPDIGISYANIGVLYASMNQLDLALEYYQKALKIFLLHNLYVHQAIVYQNIAEISYNKNQLDEAFNYYEQAATIFRKSRPHNHPNLIYIEQNINQLLR